MEKNNSLRLKTAVIVASALAAIEYGDKAVTSVKHQDNQQEEKIVFYKSTKKPMPVLKMNLFNPENSQFVASHTSHASHRSHSSHYSHRSGAMFS
jgi:hypothetical protein